MLERRDVSVCRYRSGGDSDGVTGVLVFPAEVEVLSLLLNQNQALPQLFQGLFCLCNGVEEEQVFRREFLHVVFHLSFMKQDVGSS